MSETKANLQEQISDVSAERVARVYAESLLRAATEQGQAGETLSELEALVYDVLQRQPETAEFLTSAAVSREKKLSAINHTFQDRCSPVLHRFLQVLNDHDRLVLLKPIVLVYRRLHDEQSGRMQVLVKSAVAVSEQQQTKLKDELRAAFGQEPVLTLVVDPELLGGLLVRVGDWVYDGSVRTRLEKISSQVLERSGYEIQNRRDRICNN